MLYLCALLVTCAVPMYGAPYQSSDVALKQAIEIGDLEQVRTLLQEHPAIQRNDQLSTAIQKFLDSLKTAISTDDAWFYMQVGAASVSVIALGLLCWHRHQKKTALLKDDNDEPKVQQKTLPISKNSELRPTNAASADASAHISDSDEDSSKKSSPNPSPAPSPSPDSGSSEEKPHGHHVSFSQQSDSDRSGRSGSPPGGLLASTPSTSDSFEQKPKKKGFFKTWRENKKKKKLLKEQLKELKIKKQESSSDSDDEKFRATAKTGFFSALFAKLKGKKNKRRLEHVAETRLAIVYEILNYSECDPTQVDESGMSPVTLVQQQLSEFRHGSWESRLLYDLYLLLQARSPNLNN